MFHLPDLLARWLRWWELRRRPGPRGERLAMRHLKQAGYRILGRNLRSRAGEIDLLALAPDGRTLVVAEVKTTLGLPADSRAGQAYPQNQPQNRVDAAKQRRLIATAVSVIRQQHLQGHPVRFDVLTVHLPGAHCPADARPVVRHLPGAFQTPF